MRHREHREVFVSRLEEAVMFKILTAAVVVSGIGAITGVSSLPTAAASKTSSAAPADAHGNLHVPSEYRTSYQFLGTWAIAAAKGAGSQQIHDVYASPGTIAAYRKTGQFSDGTVLIKEVFATKTAPMTTGTVSHADTLKGWFVMVRDGKNTHPGNPLWGDGWGWSWFNANDPTATTSTNYKTDCQSCHIPARSTEWIYTSGYPSLQK